MSDTCSLFPQRPLAFLLLPSQMDTTKDGMDLTEAEDIKKRNYRRNYTTKIFMTQITMMV